MKTEIEAWETVRYEVQIKRQPKRVFYTEDAALKYISLNSDEFISLVRLETAVLDFQCEGSL